MVLAGSFLPFYENFWWSTKVHANNHLVGSRVQALTSVNSSDFDSPGCLFCRVNMIRETYLRPASEEDTNVPPVSGTGTV